jgi:ribosome recycling factor|tara:strand:- start:458 stop:1015 length:558 start_codon:yes stop_codon:yes gene_type:complete
VIEDIKKDAEARMKKSLEALGNAFKKIRTGRAHPSILDGVMVSYYGADTPLKQVANINIEDGRTLAVSAWEKHLIPEIEKAIMKADLGLNPSSNGELIRVPMPPLTEQTRKEMAKLCKAEAEQGRVSIRSIRRDANSDLKDLLKEKEISEDEERKGQDDIQKLTDKYVALIEDMLKTKEADLMEV